MMKTKLTTYMSRKRVFTFFLGAGLSSIPLAYGQGLLNTGQMYVGNGNPSASLYIGGDWSHVGENVSVQQKGNTILTGNFINGVTKGNIFTVATGDSTVIFGGSAKQQILGGSQDADQVQHIGFPNIRVSNAEGVWVNPAMRVKAETLYLPGGRLVLESEPVNGKRESTTAHLLVNNVHYNRDSSNPRSLGQGLVQVNLALGNNYSEKRLVGFSSPFKTMYSDYFAYNFLSKPSPAGLFGDNGMLISAADTPMKAGEGYIIGQGIIDDENYYRTDVDPKWQGALSSDRATTQFTFARNTMPSSFYDLLKSSNLPDLFSGEELNLEDVKVSLDRQGFHYVGNPFTSPIDMTEFLQESTTNNNDWGVSRGTDINSDMRNSFYVMSGGTGEYFPENTYSKFKFSVSYLVGQNVGGTINIDPTQGNYIAPMQMFVVGKNTTTPTTLTIPASARRIDKRTNYLRSTSASPTVVDEILLQVTDQDTKAYDRVAVVFRDGASVNATDKYDATKIFNYSKGVSQIYTKSGEGKNMTTNVVSPQTKSLALNLDASSETKTSVITAHRLESLQSVEYLFLEDKKTKDMVDLLQDPSYTFTTSPTDNSDRFVLHFTRMTTGVEDVEASHQLGVYYSDGTLQITGLTADDHGSHLTLSNMQGSTLLQTQINQSPEMSIHQQLATGVYIVKVSGKNNYSTKIIAQ